MTPETESSQRRADPGASNASAAAHRGPAHGREAAASATPARRARRILFVDDEPDVLDGLRRALRADRFEYEPSFAVGGRAAIAELARETFDVVVSDLRMPDLDGAELLAHVRDRSPGTIRFVLTGDGRREEMARAVAVAHKILSKPCAPGVVRDALRNALDVRHLLREGIVEHALGEVGSTPALSVAYRELRSLLASRDATPHEIVDVVADDLAFCSHLWRLADPLRATSIANVDDARKAIASLEAKAVSRSALPAAVFQRFESAAPDLFAGELRHATATAATAAEIARGAPWANDAYVAALLHDVGKLAFAAFRPDAWRNYSRRAAGSVVADERLEVDELGATHAQAGAFVSAHWGAPYAVVDAVAHHHAFPGPEAALLDVRSTTWIADALVEEAAFPGAGPSAALAAISPFIDALDLAPRLPGWRACAAAALEET